MKKLIALILALVCVVGMVGCNNRSMNYIISNEPSITGIVKETNEDAILIENDNGEYWVSLNVENKDSMTSFNIGDEVVVYYDGNVAESYPMQINTVYAITLKTPADRTENDKSWILQRRIIIWHQSKFLQCLVSEVLSLALVLGYLASWQLLDRKHTPLMPTRCLVQPLCHLPSSATIWSAK